jgi:undecaprenyl diphosphate synthase
MKHLGIIMDGNGRWATERGLPRLSGHESGAKAVLEIIDAADELKISILSLYAFSLDNFKRDALEVLGIFGIISDFLAKTLIPLAKSRNYRLMFIGDFSKLPSHLMLSVSKANQATLNNTGMKIIIALAYSGKMEIKDAFNLILEEKLNNGDYSPITQDDIEKHLYTATIVNPDAILRFGGEKRLSDFMLYQAAYTELFFEDKMFPDATKKDIYQVVNEYNKIRRNFGDVKQ